jgi:hypothetical protein
MKRAEIFVRIPDAVAILSKGGTWKECDMYRLDQAVFAKFGGGYVRLLGDSRTSNGYAIYKIVSDVVFGTDRLNRLYIGDDPPTITNTNGYQPERLTTYA